MKPRKAPVATTDGLPVAFGDVKHAAWQSDAATDRLRASLGLPTGDAYRGPAHRAWSTALAWCAMTDALTPNKLPDYNRHPGLARLAANDLRERMATRGQHATH